MGGLKIQGLLYPLPWLPVSSAKKVYFDITPKTPLQNKTFKTGFPPIFNHVKTILLLNPYIRSRDHLGVATILGK